MRVKIVFLIFFCLSLCSLALEHDSHSQENSSVEANNSDSANIPHSREPTPGEELSEGKVPETSEAATNVNEHNQELSEEQEREQFHLFAKGLMDEMVGNSTEVSKDRFRVFLKKLITKDEKITENEEEFYSEMVDKVVEKVPDQIPVEEINKYIDQNYLMNILNEVIKEKYGDEALSDAFNEESTTNDHSSDPTPEEILNQHPDL